MEELKRFHVAGASKEALHFLPLSLSFSLVLLLIHNVIDVDMVHVESHVTHSTPLLIISCFHHNVLPPPPGPPPPTPPPPSPSTLLCVPDQFLSNRYVKLRSIS